MIKGRHMIICLPYSIFIKRKDVIMSTNKRDIKKSTITRQSETIDRLTQQIKDLEIDNDAKTEIIHTVDTLRDQLIYVIHDLQDKSRQYDEIMQEMLNMRSVLRDFVFDNKYKYNKSGGVNR